MAQRRVKRKSKSKGKWPLLLAAQNEAKQRESGRPIPVVYSMKPFMRAGKPIEQGLVGLYPSHKNKMNNTNQMRGVFRNLV